MSKSPPTPIVCLCGSTRFVDWFDEAALQMTLRGIIVLSIGSHKPRSREYADGKDGHKAGLDELHKRKIDLAHAVIVLNMGGYIGDSTRSEIKYAEAHDVPVAYLESCEPPPKEGDGYAWDKLAEGVRQAAILA